MDPEKSKEEIPDIAPEYASKKGEEWTRDGEALPEVLDPIVTKALIQRYIETERNRNRRALLWISGIFLFVVLLILTMFLSIGIFVLRKSIAAADTVEKTVEEINLQTSVYAAEVVAMSNMIEQLDENTSSIRQTVAKRYMIDRKKEQLLKSDLKRFSKWVSARDSKDKKTISELERKLTELEQASEKRQSEFEDVIQRYQLLLEAVPGGEESISAVADIVGLPLENTGTVTQATPGKAQEAAPVQEKETSPPAIQVSAEGRTARLSSGAVSVVSFPNGDTYRGSFKNGLFDGDGVYTYANGDRYEGEFQNDMKSGKGTFTFVSGDRYVGEFRNDMMNGTGTMYFDNGERYVGEFQNGRMTGKGTRYYSSGNKYEGDFKNDLKHGNGVLTFRNGDVYKGEFRDDRRIGKGTYIFSDGAKYIGEFENGKRHGRGRYIYAGGEEFIGEFRDGKKEGLGLCIYPNGQQVKGLWKNDEFVRSVEK